MNMLYLMLLLSPDNPAVFQESCERAEINTVSQGDRYLVQIIFWEKGKSLYKDKDGVRRYYDSMVVKGFKVITTERGEEYKNTEFCLTVLAGSGTVRGRMRTGRCIR